MTFGEMVQQLRIRAGMTQEALARIMDMSVSSIRDYEQGKKEPALRSAFKLAAALGVSLDVFTDCFPPDPPGASATTPPAAPAPPAATPVPPATPAPDTTSMGAAGGMSEGGAGTAKTKGKGRKKKE